MTLEDLIYARLNSCEPLTELLTKYNNCPAIFYQNAPDDTDKGWEKRKQYPRIDYVVDHRKNPERKASGTLTVNIYATEDGVLPENVEVEAKKILCDVFLKPEGGMPYALSWSRSDPFDVSRDSGSLIIGSTITFDLFAFPSQVTTDPDPIYAINRYVETKMPWITVISDKLDIASYLEPSVGKPVAYFRLDSIQTQRETNTVVWLDGVLVGHIFAAGEEIGVLQSVLNSLAIDGEITMLDGSPMFLTKLAADNTLDALSIGQMRINVRFGLLRRKIYAHPLTDPNVNIIELKLKE